MYAEGCLQSAAAESDISLLYQRFYYKICSPVQSSSGSANIAIMYAMSISHPNNKKLEAIAITLRMEGFTSHFLPRPLKTPAIILPSLERVSFLSRSEDTGELFF